MIQLISGTTAAAAGADPVALPLRNVQPASVSEHGPARPVSGPAGLAVGFHQRMLLAATANADPQPVLAQPLDPQDLPVLQASEAAADTDEVAEETSAELWLLGMLDQQQVVVQAREAQATLAWPSTAGQQPAASGGLLEEPAERQLEGIATRLPVLPAEHYAERSADRAAGTAALRPPLDGSAALPAQASAALAVGAELGAVPPAEPLLAAVDAGEAGDPSVVAVERPANSVTQGAERLLKLQAPEAKWGEQMLHALREHVEVQLQQRQQSATIRLDPPELGSMEIHLSHDAGRLTVQLSAAHADVARLLQQTSDRLRQELVAQHFVQVNVQVGADGQSGRQGQPRQPENGENVLAAANHASGTASAPDSRRSAGRASDVLVTV